MDDDGDVGETEPLVGFAEGHAVVWLLADLAPPYDDQLETLDRFRVAPADAVIRVRAAPDPDGYAFPNLT